MKSKSPKEVCAALKLVKPKVKARKGESDPHWLLAQRNERTRFLAEFNATWAGRIDELIGVMRTNCVAKTPSTTLEVVVRGGYTPLKGKRKIADVEGEDEEDEGEEEEEDDDDNNRV